MKILVERIGPLRGLVFLTAKVCLVFGSDVDVSIFGRSGIADRTTNTADTVDAQGRSRVHVGNKHGGRGIFDD